VGRIACGMQDRLYLGNLYAKRDWGYAVDYVDAMWRMLQAEHPEDYVIATGETHSVREFCEHAFAEIGIDLVWQGEGLEEKGLDRRTGRILVEIDPRYFRPTEVDLLIGDATKARTSLGWTPTTKFEELVRLMVAADVELAQRDARADGLTVPISS
jgi:GDPmannose 4,6-dehydratase